MRRGTTAAVGAVGRRARSAAAVSRRDSNTPGLRVIKFGGSSVGNADAFRGVHKVLRYYGPEGKTKGSQVVCVLSAMMGVTDKLIGAAELATEARERDVQDMRQKLFSLHSGCIRDLVADPIVRTDLTDYVEQSLQETFDPTVDAIAEAGEYSQHQKDILASMGERMSNTIMARYLCSTGTQSETVYADDNFIRTESESGGASADIEASVPLIQSKLRPMLSEGILPCVTGFIASDEQGMLTTLGRGGSDLTASIVGNALDATEVILSKVESEKDSKDGFMLRWQPGWIGIVHQQNPQLTISSMSFEEAGELANLGRKVLHRHAVYPLLEKKIPIRICNTLDGNHPGTLVGPYDSLPRARSSGSDSPKVTEITMVELEKYNALRTKSETKLEPSAVSGLSGPLFMVALIGRNIRDNDELMDRAVTILSDNDIQHQAPSLEELNSRNSFPFLVEQQKADIAVQALFEHFLRPPSRMSMDAF